MSFWDRLGSWFASSGAEGPSINPATGLPMMNSSIDVQGNPFGTDLTTPVSTSFAHHHSIGHGHNDSWTHSLGPLTSTDWPPVGGGYDPTREY
ncbi:MAG: hypothetical protein ACKVOP_10795 [Sphingomonadaceae bacterium]